MIQQHQSVCTPGPQDSVGVHALARYCRWSEVVVVVVEEEVVVVVEVALMVVVVEVALMVVVVEVALMVVVCLVMPTT